MMLSKDKNMDPDDAVNWLKEAANYFRNRETGGEDKAFWSNIANAEACERIANTLDRHTAPLPPTVQEIAEEYANIRERALASEMQWEDAEWLHDNFAVLLNLLARPHDADKTAQKLYEMFGRNGNPATAQVWEEITANKRGQWIEKAETLLSHIRAQAMPTREDIVRAISHNLTVLEGPNGYDLVGMEKAADAILATKER